MLYYLLELIPYIIVGAVCDTKNIYASDWQLWALGIAIVIADVVSDIKARKGRE